MGLVQAVKGAVSSTMADQWKEFFSCEAMPKEVLVVKGVKRVSGRNSNHRGSDNVISNGSGIAVADGQCMMIVEQGRVVDICAEPGAYTFDASSEPSVFTGDLGDSILATFQTMYRRLSYGGDTGKDQRIYFFNTKELLDNKFGTKNPVPFRVVDRNIGMDIDVAIRCSGTYSYRIANPMLFYANVCGNVQQAYLRSEMESHLKDEFVSALQPALAKLSEQGLRPNQIIAHNTELEQAMREVLSQKWSETRGLEVVSVALGSVTLPPEDAELIKQAQRTAILRDPGMAAATLAGAQADAMKSAAKNPAGAMNGFMGMNMASNAGGMNANDLFAMQAARQQEMSSVQQPVLENSWVCSCGTKNTGKFCQECGAKRPESNEWVCSCGAKNTGKFCTQCGAKRPESGEWVCSCGAKNTGRFCTQCGSKRP